MICSMLRAEWDLGRSPVHKTRPPELGRTKTQPKSWGWGEVRPILGGTKRAADLGRNVPHTLDLGRKKQVSADLRGYKTRSWVRTKNKFIHPKSRGWDGFQPILGGTKRAAELGRSVPQTLDIGRKKIYSADLRGYKTRSWVRTKTYNSMILFSGFGVVEPDFRANKILFSLSQDPLSTAGRTLVFFWGFFKALGH